MHSTAYVKALHAFALTAPLPEAAAACELIRLITATPQDAARIVQDAGLAHLLQAESQTPHSKPQAQHKAQASDKPQSTGKASASASPSNKQLLALRSLGYTGAFPRSQGQAGILIRQLQQRRATR